MRHVRMSIEGVKSWLPVVLLAVIAAAVVFGVFRQRADDARREQIQAEAERLAGEVRQVVDETARLQREIVAAQAETAAGGARTRRILERCGVRIEGAGSSAKLVLPPGREAAVRECMGREVAACQAGKCR